MRKQICIRSDTGYSLKVYRFASSPFKKAYNRSIPSVNRENMVHQLMTSNKGCKWVILILTRECFYLILLGQIPISYISQRKRCNSYMIKSTVLLSFLFFFFFIYFSIFWSQIYKRNFNIHYWNHWNWTGEYWRSNLFSARRIIIRLD